MDFLVLQWNSDLKSMSDYQLQFTNPPAYKVVAGNFSDYFLSVILCCNFLQNPK